MNLLYYVILTVGLTSFVTKAGIAAPVRFLWLYLVRNLSIYCRMCVGFHFGWLTAALLRPFPGVEPFWLQMALGAFAGQLLGEMYSHWFTPNDTAWIVEEGRAYAVVLRTGPHADAAPASRDESTDGDA